MFLGSVLRVSKHSTNCWVSNDMYGKFTSPEERRDILCFLDPFYGLASTLLILGQVKICVESSLPLGQGRDILCFLGPFYGDLASTLLIVE